MFERIGILLPIFQPCWSASRRPAIMLVRVLANARHCASGMTHNGETRRRRPGSTANAAIGVFSPSKPPNHSELATASTPGTASICGMIRIGSGCVNDTLAWAIRRVTPTKLTSAFSSTFTACSNPNSRNAHTTDSRVRVVRILRRNRWRK
jgi:hypothetical protein